MSSSIDEPASLLPHSLLHLCQLPMMCISGVQFLRAGFFWIDTLKTVWSGHYLRWSLKSGGLLWQILWALLTQQYKEPSHGIGALVPSVAYKRKVDWCKWRSCGICVVYFCFTLRSITVLIIIFVDSISSITKWRPDEKRIGNILRKCQMWVYLLKLHLVWFQYLQMRCFFCPKHNLGTLI